MNYKKISTIEANSTINIHLQNTYYGMKPLKLKELLEEKIKQVDDILLKEMLNDWFRMVDWEKLEEEYQEEQEQDEVEILLDQLLEEI